jgi:hypothetical protein
MVKNTKLFSLLGGLGLAVIAAVVAVAGATPPAGPSLTAVPAANTKSPGYAPASVLSPELRQVAVAQGATKLENPSGLFSYYGYNSDVVNSAGEPQMLPTPSSPTEAHKTEPDKNTYLVFKQGLDGADPSYDYGTHFLFQGHEGGAGGAGYITRINLDADAAHRVTLLASKDVHGNQIATIDGSTWDPWAKRLILTTENSGAPTYAATPDFPSQVTDVSGALGRGGYEGIQDDSDGNLWIAEDIGGATKPGTKARKPNSYIYRYVPQSPGDLENGVLQVLQVRNEEGKAITAASQEAVNSPDQLALHTYGKSFETRWVTVHDTAINGSEPFQALPLAREKEGTPFKRPENGVFQPGSHFTKFFFDETGDTNAEGVENANAGGWGSIFELTQSSPGADTGALRLFYTGDKEHGGFDNVTFLSRNAIASVEDAGDTLHTQRGALDSGWVWQVGTDYSQPQSQPLRWLAEGRDASATLDADNGGFGKNDGDNEITGAVVSDGDPGPQGILGARVPELGTPKWRWFYTQQHGDNVTYEVLVDQP